MGWGEVGWGGISLTGLATGVPDLSIAMMRSLLWILRFASVITSDAEPWAPWGACHWKMPPAGTMSAHALEFHVSCAASVLFS